MAFMIHVDMCSVLKKMNCYMEPLIDNVRQY